MSSERAVRAVLKATAKRSVKASNKVLSQAKRIQAKLTAMNVQLQRGDFVSAKEAKALSTQVESWYRSLVAEYGRRFSSEPSVKESVLHSQTIRENADMMVYDTQRIVNGNGNPATRQKYFVNLMVAAANNFIQSFNRVQNQS